MSLIHVTIEPCSSDPVQTLGIRGRIHFGSPSLFSPGPFSGVRDFFNCYVRRLFMSDPL